MWKIQQRSDFSQMVFTLWFWGYFLNWPVIISGIWIASVLVKELWWCFPHHLLQNRYNCPFHNITFLFFDLNRSSNNQVFLRLRLFPFRTCKIIRNQYLALWVRFFFFSSKKRLIIFIPFLAFWWPMEINLYFTMRR